MKKLLHKIICIRTSDVLRIWGEPKKSIATRSLYLFGFKVCDLGTRKINNREYLREFNSF